MAKLKRKSLCELVDDKLRKKDFPAYVQLIDAPQYVCSKCGRAANRKKNLCDPRKIS
jgi:hypothetical protein